MVIHKEKVIVRAEAGANVDDVMRDMAIMALKEGTTVETEFNGVKLTTSLHSLLSKMMEVP